MNLPTKKLRKRNFIKLTSLQEYLKGVCFDATGRRLTNSVVLEVEDAYNHMNQLRDRLHLVVGDRVAVHRIIEALFTMKGTSE